MTDALGVVPRRRGHEASRVMRGMMMAFVEESESGRRRGGEHRCGQRRVSKYFHGSLPC